MRRRLAAILRRLADRIAPQPCTTIYLYGKPPSAEDAVRLEVALRRRYGLPPDPPDAA